MKRILRREGLYPSHIAERRKQAEAGDRENLARQAKERRGAEEAELERLRARNPRLEVELAKATTALEITAKYTRPWSSSRRARTPRRSASRDRHPSVRLDDGDGTEAGVRAARREPFRDSTPPPATEVGAAGATEQAHGSRAATHPGRVAFRGALRSRTSAGVWARLLDDDVYLCSIRAMYRLFAAAGPNRERR